MEESVLKKMAGKIRKLVGMDKLKEAFDALNIISDNIPELRDEVIQHQGNYSSIANQSQIGTLQREDKEILFSKVRNALVSIAKKLDEGSYQILEVSENEIKKYKQDKSFFEGTLYELNKVATSQFKNKFNLLANTVLTNGINILESSLEIVNYDDSNVQQSLINFYQSSQYFEVRLQEVLGETTSIVEKLESDDFFDTVKSVTDIFSSVTDAIQGKNEGFLNRHSQNLVLGAENYTMFCISEIGKIIAFYMLGNQETRIKTVFREIKNATEVAERLNTEDWLPILSRAYQLKLIPQSILKMDQNSYQQIFNFDNSWFDDNHWKESTLIGRTISSQSIERAANIFFTWRALHNFVLRSENIGQLFSFVEKYGVNYCTPHYLPVR